MKLNDSASTIVLWLRAVETQLDNLEESVLWKSLTEAIPGDYVRINFNDHLGNAISKVFDLANRFQELQDRLESESSTDE